MDVRDVERDFLDSIRALRRLGIKLGIVFALRPYINKYEKNSYTWFAYANTYLHSTRTW